MKKLNTHSDADKIIEYLSQGERDDIQLSDSLKEKLDRLYTCSKLIRKYGSRLKVVPIMIKLFGPKYSQTTAYRDFEDTQEVFGSTQVTSRDFWADIILGMMMETRNKAFKDKDYKVAATAEKNIKDAILELIGSGERLPYEKLQPPDITISFFKELTGVHLPENWESKVKVLLQKKEKNTSAFDEAQLLDE